MSWPLLQDAQSFPIMERTLNQVHALSQAMCAGFP